MSLTFQVPTLSDQKAAQDLKQLILVSVPDANVDIDSQAKTVTIDDSQASEETFNQLIVAAGHHVTSAQ
ncbi:MAG: heavy metal transport/detoxification protein [Leptolyngbya sp.]|jgi:copper chaperone|uniref:Heavy metal transport/detoxification protein n=1 Tax=Shackletoniella antarctica TaxID=268115 RepID=A0A2W4VX48_9CYAN|nr:MAG: heavy metal transport/detoxification protein [Shackletoniella antarctica]PZV09128.1 MAG: heavy metal transport/detoxification protein [Leptolyngbya sp.]